MEDDAERKGRDVFEREREAAELRTAMANKTRRMQLNLMRLRCVAKSGVERLRSEMQFVKRTCQSEVELVRKNVDTLLSNLLLRHKELSMRERYVTENETLSAKSLVAQEAKERLEARE